MIPALSRIGAAFIEELERSRSLEAAAMLVKTRFGEKSNRRYLVEILSGVAALRRNIELVPTIIERALTRLAHGDSEGCAEELRKLPSLGAPLALLVGKRRSLYIAMVPPKRWSGVEVSIRDTMKLLALAGIASLLDIGPGPRVSLRVGSRTVVIEVATGIEHAFYENVVEPLSLGSSPPSSVLDLAWRASLDKVVEEMKAAARILGDRVLGTRLVGRSLTLDLAMGRASAELRVSSVLRARARAEVSTRGLGIEASLEASHASSLGQREAEDCLRECLARMRWLAETSRKIAIDCSQAIEASKTARIVGRDTSLTLEARCGLHGMTVVVEPGRVVKRAVETLIEHHVSPALVAEILDRVGIALSSISGSRGSRVTALVIETVALPELTRLYLSVLRGDVKELVERAIEEGKRRRRELSHVERVARAALAKAMIAVGMGIHSDTVALTFRRRHTTQEITRLLKDTEPSELIEPGDHEPLVCGVPLSKICGESALYAECLETVARLGISKNRRDLIESAAMASTKAARWIEILRDTTELRKMLKRER